MDIDKYNQVFMSIFEINDVKKISTMQYRHSEKWDSIGHMMLCVALEDAFDIHLEGEDILKIQSYETGKDVLKKYDIIFEA